jgi:PilZ domain
MSYQDRLKSITSTRVTAKPAVKEAEPCNRRSRRKPTALPAMLTFPNMRLAVPALVSDMSGSGAKVSLADPQGDVGELPDRLTLVLSADFMQVDCDVVWRTPGKLGLRFLGPPRPTERPARR